MRRVGPQCYTDAILLVNQSGFGWKGDKGNKTKKKNMSIKLLLNFGEKSPLGPLLTLQRTQG